MVTSQQLTPGVYREEIFPKPAPGLFTGVPVFLGFAETGPINSPQSLTLWSQFTETFGQPLADGYLAYAVRGFFENGGSLCLVVRLEDTVSITEALGGPGDDSGGLGAIASLNEIDLVCVPDLMRGNPDQDDLLRMQNVILEHCDLLGDRFAILDSLPPVAVQVTQSLERVKEQRSKLRGKNGALYYPWIKAENGPDWMPPCGHIAGVYARSDQQFGVHKAPANETIEGIVDLKFNLTNREQDILNPLGVNCLRAFPGRGIRVWGARTLSDEANWIYVNVKRLFLTVGRWLELNLANLAFEPNELKLWVRIERELTAYFEDLLQQGALKGPTEQTAFYIKCDAETNPPEVREAGMVVTEIGLAPAIPSEFITVRIILGASGVKVAT
ncbi:MULTISPECIES: phage tail sheath subtilisin-like domain-containing protein [unclassified Moorena]|uniref:phage tail sheath family protein n=1 Tax=unclassified Moorena TaxID=2683338 RepID=UPI0013FFD165|nr:MULTISPECIES: phage tail sheath subtilisin-like domain-containing protein [unclassified Moorena]NEO16316.1 phage tail sheath family protein [Moorena sp. SIO3E8]NEQ02842.1 phage tail sheath family protein [Moorena sp. SIO3F7]